MAIIIIKIDIVIILLHDTTPHTLRKKKVDSYKIPFQKNKTPAAPTFLSNDRHQHKRQLYLHSTTNQSHSTQRRTNKLDVFYKTKCKYKITASIHYATKDLQENLSFCPHSPTFLSKIQLKGMAGPCLALA